MDVQDVLGRRVQIVTEQACIRPSGSRLLEAQTL
jgi:hypothetical protein